MDRRWQPAVAITADLPVVRRVRRLAGWLTAVMLAMIVHSARGQSVPFVTKLEGFLQNSSAEPLVDPEEPFQIRAQATASALLSAPNGNAASLLFSASTGRFEFARAFGSKAAFDAAFPAGLYRLSGSGLPATSVTLGADSYPLAVPRIVGGVWSEGFLVLDPTRANIIEISSFSGYASAGFGGLISVQLSGVRDSVRWRSEAASRALPGVATQAAPFSSVTIPAGTLSAGRVYEGVITFTTLTAADSTVPGSMIAGCGRTVRFYVAALSPTASSSQVSITRQPENQEGVLGGTVSFSVGATEIPFGSVVEVIWSRNDCPLNHARTTIFDDGKYTWNGYGLRINRFDPADEGTYVVTLVTQRALVATLPIRIALVAAAAPVIVEQPESKTVNSGDRVVFRVAATGVPAPTFEWRRNGVGLFVSGPVLTSSAASPGDYSVVVSNSAGSVTSETARLTTVSAADPGRIVNLSILTSLAAGETMTLGTVLPGPLDGQLTTSLLVRGVGPSLQSLGINGAHPDPRVTLTKTSEPQAVFTETNDDWGGTPALVTEFARVGAFPYSGPTSRDAALLLRSLLFGTFTVQVSGARPDQAGIVLAELYAATPNPVWRETQKLKNVSVLKQIAASGMTAGFVIQGTTAKTVLIRANGPALERPPFNLSGVLADPRLTLFNGNGVLIATNDNWGGGSVLDFAALAAGAFAVTPAESRDAALLLSLNPGGYTVQVAGAGNAAGLVLVEVYEL